ncbi:MAG: 16S rRNA (cytosine(1402)-N(4))-methyltransferase RsmH [Elusimicrobia bacterium]|nr:16S rRNA (cytosine(1402)-N(4))-methyltransferase RsmH [Elusimicrobiota bacterium]
MDSARETHSPVLLEETMRFWVTKKDGFYIDLTLGMAGHADELLSRYPKASCLGLDWDFKSLELARERLQKWGTRVIVRQANFADIGNILENLKIEAADGMLFDLGPSAYQIFKGNFGISYQKDEYLDMRLGGRETMSPAADLLKALTPAELQCLLTDFGDLPGHLAKKIAGCIKSAAEPPQTTGQLVGLLGIVSSNRRIWARVFQSLRLVVNREMENLNALVAAIPGCLRPGGRAVAITFHSLEDRLVKQAFKKYAREGLFKLLTPKPATAANEEVRSNPRSRSAKLRAVEKCGAKS